MLFWLFYLNYLCTVETYYYCKRVCERRADLGCSGFGIVCSCAWSGHLSHEDDCPRRVRLWHLRQQARRLRKHLRLLEHRCPLESFHGVVSNWPRLHQLHDDRRLVEGRHAMLRCHHPRPAPLAEVTASPQTLYSPTCPATPSRLAGLVFVSTHICTCTHEAAELRSKRFARYLLR